MSAATTFKHTGCPFCGERERQLMALQVEIDRHVERLHAAIADARRWETRARLAEHPDEADKADAASKASKPLGVPLNPMQRARLREAAMMAGSQGALARRLGYSAKSVSGWIRGELNPSQQVLDVLTAAGIDLSG